MPATTQTRGTHIRDPLSARSAFLSRKVQRGRQAGSALVQLAILGPVLTLLLAGVVDVSRIFYYGIVVANAARAGAEYAIEGNYPTTSSIVSSIQSAAALDAQASISSGFSASSNVTPAPSGSCICPPSWSAVTCNSTDPTTTTCSDGSSARLYVTVNTHYCYSLLFKAFPYNDWRCSPTTRKIYLTGQAKMRMEYAHPPHTEEEGND